MKKMCDLPSEFLSSRPIMAYFPKYTYSMQVNNVAHLTIHIGMKRGWQQLLTCHNKF